MSTLLICFLIMLYTFQSFFGRKYTDNYPGDPNDASDVLTVVYGLVVAVISMIFSGFVFEFNVYTLCFGIANAVALIGYNAFLVKASQTGSYSIMMVFNLCGGIVIPAIVSLFFGDKLSVIQIVAILAIFVSVYMMSKKKEDVKNPAVFFVFCTLLAVCNGVYGALLNAQQKITSVSQKEEMVIYTFMISSVVALITLFIKKKGTAVTAFKQTKKSCVYLIACAVVAALAINLLVIILEIIESPTLLYTFDNAGVMLMSVLLSAIVFKEKLSKVNVIGCVIMCIGLICMSLFNVETTEKLFDAVRGMF